ncbi:MAG: phosphatase domain-containing protein, partial [Myxococcota bacterium]
MRVYRWDLDKTYLQTDIDSVRGLVRSAIEPARSKRAVPGAPALLRELARERPGWRPRIYILSGSPTQMRPVLEQKLRLDGVRFDEFVLKDNLLNLKRGRIRAVRGQFGYKLPQLLRARVGLGGAVRESLFGDDAEVDALVYSVYADAIAGRIGATELSRVLAAAGAYPDHIVDALAALRQVALADAVDRIFIRLDRGRPLTAFEPLGTRVVPVRSWFEAALVLYGAGEMSAE